MSGVLWLLLSSAAVLVLLYAPGTVAVRLLRGSWALALALAPALGLALVGVTSVIAQKVGLSWSLLPWGLAVAVVLGVAALARRFGIALPVTVLDGPLLSRRLTRYAVPAVVLAAALAILPIASAAGWRPDAVLERWDALYHLSALQWIRESGSASPLTLGAISNSQHIASTYPAAFHALATLVPGAPVPILLNGATLAVATVPWILGIALLARAVHPHLAWAPAAAAVLAALIPGTPLNEWIHLSPIPNLTGFAALPGLLAAAVMLFAPLLRGAGARTWVLVAVLLGTGGLGLLLTHPNTAVMALLLLAVLTAHGAVRERRWVLALLPLLLLVPVTVLQLTPLGGMVTDFTGGLKVPWWTGVGEVVLGLHTVWPMALGVVIALAWWPGLVRCTRDARAWVVAGWVIVVVLYLDAAVDSPLNLSVLFYRGQDRLTMPLAMLSCVLAVEGLAWWGRFLLTARGTATATAARRAIAMVLVAVAVLAVGLSVPARAGNSAKNLETDYPGRGRFLQADELAAWNAAAEQMDPSQKVLASPFTGASHMWALHGQSVQFAVAGTSLRHRDELLMQAAVDAASDPVACAFLQRWEIGYVYQDRTLYQYDPRYSALDGDLSGIGPVVFSTSHSTLYEVQCDPGDGDIDYDPF